MKLYQGQVYEQIRTEGVFVTITSAEAVDVHGKLYAEVYGSLYAADGWHETEAAAREEAAAKVEAMSQVLQAQAGRIRAGGR
jgi:hypothetical protein